MTPSLRKLTVLAVALDGHGHINACVSIGQQLRQRGHRVVFALDKAWTGIVSKYEGLEEEHFEDKTRDANLGPNEYWFQFMDEFRKTFAFDPIDALENVNIELSESCLYTLLNVDEHIKAIIDKVKPDVILLDNYVTVPAIYNSSIPWVWITSAGPLTCLPSDDLPPAKTGYPTDGDRSKWLEYKKLSDEIFEDIMERFNETMTKYNIPPHPPGSSIHQSPYLNIYAYPLELDYLDIRPLPPKWRRFDHFIRKNEVDHNFRLPEAFKSCPDSRLLFVSMGSMGCADDRLMRRLVKILAASRHRTIVSLGPQLGKIDLPANIVGYRFLPQTQVLPLVDLVITHGGNNTFVESIYYGKPMIVMPLFADQMDNGQRALETGVGRRINPYTCSPEELLAMVDDLLENDVVKAKVNNISKRIQTSNSTLEAALAVENIALRGDSL